MHFGDEKAQSAAVAHRQILCNRNVASIFGRSVYGLRAFSQLGFARSDFAVHTFASNISVGMRRVAGTRFASTFWIQSCRQSGVGGEERVLALRIREFHRRRLLAQRCQSVSLIGRTAHPKDSSSAIQASILARNSLSGTTLPTQFG